MKEFGEGVKRIYREMVEVNLPSPTFKKQAFMTIATIKNNFVLDNGTHEIVNSSTSNEMNIIENAIKTNPKITRTVQRLLESDSKIKFIGFGNNGHWEILFDEPNKNHS